MKKTLALLVVLVAILGATLIALNVNEILTIHQQQVQVQHLSREVQQQDRELANLAKHL